MGCERVPRTRTGASAARAKLRHPLAATQPGRRHFRMNSGGSNAVTTVVRREVTSCGACIR